MLYICYIWVPALQCQSAVFAWGHGRINSIYRQTYPHGIGGRWYCLRDWHMCGWRQETTMSHGHGIWTLTRLQHGLGWYGCMIFHRRGKLLFSLSHSQCFNGFIITRIIIHLRFLSHLPLDKMAAISQTTFSSAFSWMKSFIFRFKFYWNLFLMFQLTETQHWFT